MNSFKTLFLTGLLLSASQSLMAQVVIEDQGVSLTQGELEYIVTNGWNNQMINDWKVLRRPSVDRAPWLSVAFPWNYWGYTTQKP